MTSVTPFASGVVDAAVVSGGSVYEYDFLRIESLKYGFSSKCYTKSMNLCSTETQYYSYSRIR